MTLPDGPPAAQTFRAGERDVARWEAHNAAELIALDIDVPRGQSFGAVEVDLQLATAHLAHIRGTPHAVRRDDALAGSDWPEASENMLFDLSDEFMKIAKSISEEVPNLDQAANDLFAAWKSGNGTAPSSTDAPPSASQPGPGQPAGTPNAQATPAPPAQAVASAGPGDTQGPAATPVGAGQQTAPANAAPASNTPSSGSATSPASNGRGPTATPQQASVNPDGPPPGGPNEAAAPVDRAPAPTPEQSTPTPTPTEGTPASTPTDNAPASTPAESSPASPPTEAQGPTVSDESNTPTNVDRDSAPMSGDPDSGQSDAPAATAPVAAAPVAASTPATPAATAQHPTPTTGQANRNGESTLDTDPTSTRDGADAPVDSKADLHPATTTVVDAESNGPVDSSVADQPETSAEAQSNDDGGPRDPAPIATAAPVTSDPRAAQPQARTSDPARPTSTSQNSPTKADTPATDPSRPNSRNENPDAATPDTDPQSSHTHEADTNDGAVDHQAQENTHEQGVNDGRNVVGNSQGAGERRGGDLRVQQPGQDAGRRVSDRQEDRSGPVQHGPERGRGPAGVVSGVETGRGTGTANTGDGLARSGEPHRVDLDAPTTSVNTGGSEHDLNFSGQTNRNAQKLAEHASWLLRSHSGDVTRIAANVGDAGIDLSAADVQRIKQHLFQARHTLPDPRGGTRVDQFDASPDINSAWLRLVTGSFSEQDVMLLRHELAELNAMAAGMTQEQAHALANEQADWESDPSEVDLGLLKEFTDRNGVQFQAQPDAVQRVASTEAENGRVTTAVLADTIGNIAEELSKKSWDNTAPQDRASLLGDVVQTAMDGHQQLLAIQQAPANANQAPIATTDVISRLTDASFLTRAASRAQLKRIVRALTGSSLAGMTRPKLAAAIQAHFATAETATTATDADTRAAIQQAQDARTAAFNQQVLPQLSGRSLNAMRQATRDHYAYASVDTVAAIDPRDPADRGPYQLRVTPSEKGNVGPWADLEFAVGGLPPGVSVEIGGPVIDADGNPVHDPSGAPLSVHANLDALAQGSPVEAKHGQVPAFVNRPDRRAALQTQLRNQLEAMIAHGNRIHAEVLASHGQQAAVAALAQYRATTSELMLVTDGQKDASGQRIVIAGFNEIAAELNAEFTGRDHQITRG